MSTSGDPSADFILWLTRALKCHFFYLKIFSLRRWLLFLPLCIFQYKYCCVLYLLCPAWGGWNEVLQSPREGSLPGTTAGPVLGIAGWVALPGCSLCWLLWWVLCSAFSSQKACWSLQKHTCPAVGGGLPEGNLNLSVSEAFCSLRLWAVE